MNQIKDLTAVPRASFAEGTEKRKRKRGMEVKERKGEEERERLLPVWREREIKGFSIKRVGI